MNREKGQCYCCKRDKEGSYVDGKWVCDNCNHLGEE